MVAGFNPRLCGNCKTVFTTPNCHTCGWPDIEEYPIEGLTHYEWGYLYGETDGRDTKKRVVPRIWTVKQKEDWRMGYADGIGDVNA